MTDRQTVGENTTQARAEHSGAMWEARREARQDVVDEFQTIDDPQEIGLEQNGWGVGPSEDFLGWAQPQEVAHEFDREIDHYEIGPDYVEETDDGWGLTSGGQRRVVASEFEQETPLEEVDPYDDVRRDGDEFELRDDALERAYEIDPGWF